MRDWRWAKAVASTGTRPIAPPSTRSCATRIGGIRCIQVIDNRTGRLAVNLVDKHCAPHGRRVVVARLRREHLGVTHRAGQIGERLSQGTERGQGALPGFHAAGVDEHGEHNQPAVMLNRQERHGRGGHDIGNRGELVWGGFRLCDKAGNDLGRRRQDEHPAHDRVDFVQPELETGGHAKVPAAAAERPEQVGVVTGVHMQEPAVCGDDFGGQQAVDGETVLADQVAHTAAQCDPADAHRAGVAEPEGQAVGVCHGSELTGGQTRLNPGRAVSGVDVQPAQLLEIENDAAFADAVTGAAVTAAADGQLQAGLARRARRCKPRRRRLQPG